MMNSKESKNQLYNDNYTEYETIDYPEAQAYENAPQASEPSNFSDADNLERIFSTSRSVSYDESTDYVSADNVGYESDDSGPSATTMQFLNDKELYGKVSDASKLSYDYYSRREADRYNEEKANDGYKIRAKARVMIAVYALAVLTIFALIILNTHLLRTMNVEMSALETRAETLREERDALSDTFDSVSDDLEIERRAQEMGMTKNN